MCFCLIFPPNVNRIFSSVAEQHSLPYWRCELKSKESIHWCVLDQEQTKFCCFSNGKKKKIITIFMICWYSLSQITVNYRFSLLSWFSFVLFIHFLPHSVAIYPKYTHNLSLVCYRWRAFFHRMQTQSWHTKLSSCHANTLCLSFSFLLFLSISFSCALSFPRLTEPHSSRANGTSVFVVCTENQQKYRTQWFDRHCSCLRNRIQQQYVECTQHDTRFTINFRIIGVW